MTSVYASSYLALTSSTTSKNTAAYDDALFSLDTGSNSQTTTTTSQSISGVFSSGLSADTLGALFNSSNGVDPLDALFAAVNNDTSSSNNDNNGGISDSVAALLGLGGTSGTSGTDLFGMSDTSDYLYGDGPLPGFLKMVKAQLGLNQTQSTALDNIALQFRDANNTPETVQKVADALRQAGITSA